MNEAHYREKLLAQRDQLRHLLEENRQALKDNPDQGVDDTSAGSSDTEIADAASSTYQQELDLTFAQRHQDRLMQVEQALWRLDHGLFGKCLRCGQTIPAGRLGAFPETPFCFDCASQVEAAA